MGRMKRRWLGLTWRTKCTWDADNWLLGHCTVSIHRTWTWWQRGGNSIFIHLNDKKQRHANTKATPKQNGAMRGYGDAGVPGFEPEDASLDLNSMISSISEPCRKIKTLCLGCSCSTTCCEADASLESWPELTQNGFGISLMHFTG